MTFILHKTILLTLCLSLTYAAICPSGVVSVTSFPTITDLTKASESYDAIYEIKQDTTSGLLTLNGYKVVTVDTTAAQYFDIKQFTTHAEPTWEIVTVSKLGNCVIVADQSYLIAFETSQTSFNQVQKFNAEGFTSVIPS